MTDTKGESLAIVLRQVQAAQGVSTDDLADAAGVAVSTMRSVLNGELRCPPSNRIEAWAERLGVSPGELRRAAERDGCRYVSERNASEPDEQKPSPASGESHDDFIERCMSSAEAQRDFPDDDQRLAFCESQWRGNRRAARSDEVERKAVPFECKVDRGQRIIEGYASTFDRDKVDDIIEPGAFQKTLRERPGEVKVLWQHMDALGKPMHMEEDSTGLFTRSKISKTTLGDDALTLMEDGVVDRMSIGFTIPEGKARFDSDGWTRRISEVKLIEYSPVTFAANDAAVISSVKEMYAQAQQYGRDAFGHRADELRDLLKHLEALLAPSEPCGTGRNTRSSEEPPAPTDDPLSAAMAEVQSLSKSAEGFALQATRQRVEYPHDR